MQSLVTPEALSFLLASPDLVLLDVRASLTDPDAGRRAYEVSHLPGARFVDFDQVVSARARRATVPGLGRRVLLLEKTRIFPHRRCSTVASDRHDGRHHQGTRLDD